MIWQPGQVAGRRAGQVVIAMRAPEHCRRCARGEGCGAGVFSRLFSRRVTRLTVPADPSLRAGEPVRVGVTASGLAIAAAVHYGLSLLSLLCGAWLGHTLAAAQPWQDLAALGGGVAGLAVSLTLAGRRFEPLLNPVVERLSCTSSDATSVAGHPEISSQ